MFVRNVPFSLSRQQSVSQYAHCKTEVPQMKQSNNLSCSIFGQQKNASSSSLSSSSSPSSLLSSSSATSTSRDSQQLSSRMASLDLNRPSSFQLQPSQTVNSSSSSSKSTTSSSVFSAVNQTTPTTTAAVAENSKNSRNSSRKTLFNHLDSFIEKVFRES